MSLTNAASIIHPAPEAGSRFIPTLNQMGYMSSALDHYSQAFIDYASTQPLRCLEVGAAYGVVSLQALHKGIHMVVNDLCEDHLQMLSQQVHPEYLGFLDLRPGRFPDIFTHETEKFGAVLAARVLHFMKGEEVEFAVEEIYRLLTPGGKFFVICETPFLSNLLNYQEDYKRKKVSGDRWPGFIDNFSAVASSRADHVPPFLNLFDMDTLTRTLKGAGFNVESCEYLDRSDFPSDIRFDGRESVGAIAVKPL